MIAHVDVLVAALLESAVLDASRSERRHADVTGGPFASALDEDGRGPPSCHRSSRRAATEPAEASGRHNGRIVSGCVDLKSLSNRKLLDAWTQILDVLHERGIVRTYNNPIGDIAEMVARSYGGIRGTFAQAAWDVAVGDDLLQV